MDEKKFKEKLVEFLMELSKPNKYEVGYVQPNRTVNDGLNMLGINANDILGFARTTEDRRVRRSRGAQAWFKKMYEDGWRYAGNFEYEGLLNNGFVVMEREIPNRTLDAIKEELDVMLRDGTEFVPIRKISISADDVPKELMEMREEYIHKINTTKNALKSMGYKEDEITLTEINKVKEPKEGFESEVDDFIKGSAEDMKGLEETFFDETGKNAIWRGKETKAFKSWKENLD